MKRITFLLSTFLLTACVHSHIPNKRSEPKPIQAGERVHIGITDKNSIVLGLSFISPNESNWKIIRSGLNATLIKENDTLEENQEIEAYIIRLDIPFQPISQYINKIENNIQEDYKENPNFRIQALSIDEYSENNQCVKIHLLLKDLRSERNGKQSKWSEQYALSCASSIFDGMGYELRYYHRYYEQNKDDQFINKVDTLFKSVKTDE